MVSVIRLLADMKKAGIALGTSIGLVLLGSSVCLPGPCGCASWLGISNAGNLQVPFMLLSFTGEFGAFVSFWWLAIATVFVAFSKGTGSD
jgi:hypothetical protein